MSRSDRLFVLMEAFRTLGAPLTAERLAQETGVSTRSIYRDVESLRKAGAQIEGERGVGYSLVEDGALRPQAFTRIELEALVLGLAEVRQVGDLALAKAADSVLGKVSATLPSRLQQNLLHAVSRLHRFDRRFPEMPDLLVVREACWHEEALAIGYADRKGAVSTRTIWPLSIVYLDRSIFVLAWCCLREDFRMFRADRLRLVVATGKSFRPRRARLLREHLAQFEGLERSQEDAED